MRSLRATLILGTTIGTAAVLVAAGVLLYGLGADALLDQFDRALFDKARLLASAMEWEGGQLDLNVDEFDMHEFAAPDRPAYLEVWLPDGAVAFRSPSLGQEDLRPVAGPIDAPALRPVTLPDGRAGRAVGILFVPRIESKQEGEPKDDEAPAPGAAAADDAREAAVTLVLARETAPVDATLARLKVLLVVVGLAALAVSAAVLSLIVRSALRPVDHLAGRIAALDERDLAERVDVPSVPQELRPVVDRLNELLGRLRTAFERERAFSADVAHELRTPLAGLRTTMDVALTRERRPDEYRAALEDCLRITAHLQGMVENLLSLARLESGQVGPGADAVSPNDLLRDAWATLEETAAARRLRVEWALGPEHAVTSDAALLALVARNILENAAVHADEGGSVRIETAPRGSGVEVRVTNTGSALSQDEAEQAFGRFWRGDAARTDAGVRCGLGLPLVGKIVAVLGGSVSVRSSRGGEFEMVVTVPASPPSP